MSWFKKEKNEEVRPTDSYYGSFRKHTRVSNRLQKDFSLTQELEDKLNAVNKTKDFLSQRKYINPKRFAKLLRFYFEKKLDEEFEDIATWFKSKVKNGEVKIKIEEQEDKKQISKEMFRDPIEDVKHNISLIISTETNQLELAMFMLDSNQGYIEFHVFIEDADVISTVTFSPYRHLVNLDFEEIYIDFLDALVELVEVTNSKK